MKEITFDIEGIGTVTMIGTGPWRVASNGGASHEIKDSAGQVTNPTIIQKFSTTGRKPNRNVIFAKLSDAQAVVDKANETLAAA
jgi:hypothetical protein